MGLITHAARFHVKRQCVKVKEEDNETLLNRMQNSIDQTLTELKSGVDQMRVLFESSKAVQDEQDEFRDHLKNSHLQSIRLVNFAGLLTDFGPQKTVKSLREIHQVELLSPELYLSQTLRSRKVTLEEGDMPESSEEEDESVNFTKKIF